MSRVTLKGLDKVIANFDTLDKDVVNKVKNQIKISTNKVMANAKKKAPIDTGRLRKSITRDYENAGLTGIVYTPVEYAPFVEFGTRRQKEQPYMFPALEEELPDFEKGVKKAIKTAIGGIRP